ELRKAADPDRSLEEVRELRTEALRLLSLSQYKDALTLAGRALSLAEQTLGAGHLYVGLIASVVATSYNADSNYPAARSMYERSLKILEARLGAQHPQTAGVMRRLGGVLQYLNDYTQADQLLSRALEVEEKTLGPEHPRIALTLKSLGILHSELGDYAKALPEFTRALAIEEKSVGTDGLRFGEALNNLGVAYLRSGNYPGAEPYLKRALILEEKLLGREDPYLAPVINNLGLIARETRDYHSAEVYYQRALALKEKSPGPDSPEFAVALLNIGDLHRATGDYPSGLALQLRALGILEKSAGPRDLRTIRLFGYIARTYAALGDFDAATQFEERAESALDEVFASNLAIGSERQKLAFLEAVFKQMHQTISLNLQFAPANAAATALAAGVVARRKGRVLDVMSDRLAAISQRSGSADRVLLNRLRENSEQLARVAFNGRDPKAILELEASKDKLEADISRNNPEFRAQVQPARPAALQQAIPDGAALLEFAVYRAFDPKAETTVEVLGESRYAVYVLRRDGLPTGIDLGAAAAIDAAVGRLREALRDPHREDVKELARTLDEKVMQPVRAELGNTTQLLISPDGELSLIPMETLVDEHGSPLIKRYSISYLTTGRDLLRLEVERTGKGPTLILANPLFGEPGTEQVTAARPRKTLGRSITTGADLSKVYFGPLTGTAQEARAIQSLFPDARVLTGDRATKAALQQAQAPGILHIATHGFFLEDAADTAQPRAIRGGSRIEDPLLRSGLALAGANLRRNAEDNGILTALEASHLNLWGTRLVTLSACETGVGEVRNSEGVYGLRRAFVLAGAETLVMSLWPVSDRITRELMTDFYTGLKSGLGRGEALREAQLTMLKRKDRQHPFYWASFIESGDWRNLDG
ncbi:MAG TPA: CHAT domain-containing tetratricopeptide repeat protein, partial [Bryobacteraceae bacterium]